MVFLQHERPSQNLAQDRFKWHEERRRLKVRDTEGQYGIENSIERINQLLDEIILGKNETAEAASTERDEQTM